MEKRIWTQTPKSTQVQVLDSQRHISTTQNINYADPRTFYRCCLLNVKKPNVWFYFLLFGRCVKADPAAVLAALEAAQSVVKALCEPPTVSIALKSVLHDSGKDVQEL